jgi:hypothetical protein
MEFQNNISCAEYKTFNLIASVRSQTRFLKRDFTLLARLSTLRYAQNSESENKHAVSSVSFFCVFFQRFLRSGRYWESTYSSSQFIDIEMKCIDKKNP